MVSSLLMGRRTLPIISNLPPVLGYTGWWDASQISGVADDTPLSSWPDLSGNGYAYSQSTSGDQMTYYKTTSGKLVNGNPAVWANGTSDFMTATGPVYGSANTVYIVGSGFTSSSSYIDSSNNSYGSGPAFIFGFTANELQFYNQISSGNTTDEQEFGVVGSSVFAACWAQTDGSSLIGYLNNNTPVFNVTPHNANNGIANKTIGCSYGGSNHAAGAYCEKLIFPSQHNATQVGSMMNYFANKWGT